LPFLHCPFQRLVALKRILYQLQGSLLPFCAGCALYRFPFCTIGLRAFLACLHPPVRVISSLIGSLASKWELSIFAGRWRPRPAPPFRLPPDCRFLFSPFAIPQSTGHGLFSTRLAWRALCLIADFLFLAVACPLSFRASFSPPPMPPPFPPLLASLTGA